MPRASASRELLAPREDVWAFIAEPHHFPDWWPGIAGVRPDRRGVADGARWEVYATSRPTLLRAAGSTSMLLVRAARPPECFAWTLVRDRIDAELRLTAPGPTRTLAILELRSSWPHGFSRALPRRALNRLHALCQTATGP
jgi:uncharacterized protein YndB with AHSA1/START domain